MSVHVTNVRLFTTTDDSRIRMASFCFFPQLKEIHNFKEDFRIYSPPVAKISLFLFLGVKEGGEMYFVLNTAPSPLRDASAVLPFCFFLSREENVTGSVQLVST